MCGIDNRPPPLDSATFAVSDTSTPKALFLNSDTVGTQWQTRPQSRWGNLPKEPWRWVPNPLVLFGSVRVLGARRLGTRFFFRANQENRLCLRSARQMEQTMIGNLSVHKH